MYGIGEGTPERECSAFHMAAMEDSIVETRRAESCLASPSESIRLLCALLSSAVMAPKAIAGDSTERDTSVQSAEDSFQYDALFDPSPGQLIAETRGRIIYDRLDESVVDRAFDEQVERIEHIMFIRIRKPNPESNSAADENDDDGC
jgi:hypothetical protein